MSAILDFYRDEAAWNNGNGPPSPCGYTHFDIVHNWSDSDWEHIHDFIQWVFPLKEPSNFNPDAPILTDEDIAIFKADPELKQAVYQSFHRFMRFLGLKCRWDRDQEKWITKPMEANQYGPGDEFLTKEQIKQKEYLWAAPNHNWLRITRCLRSMRLLSCEELSDSAFDALCEIHNNNLTISHETFQYWWEAAKGDL